ncbi:hypothetical protein QR680_018290 [Steinernema hermaphroditum]|uniref:Uncharacterized protein n=1 Tax=Steinernema hermaphroditum TaxID=289476 RepID=A0AA39HIS2_9BILA|nr:hypothetical protein QR680_018290 [Steinernema hermaphroditum]
MIDAGFWSQKCFRGPPLGRDVPMWTAAMVGVLAFVVTLEAAPMRLLVADSSKALESRRKVEEGRRLLSRPRRSVERYTIWEIIHKRFRDPLANKKKDIIWSPESKYHPEFGRIVDSVGDDKDRVSVYSLYMSFGILGFVITFIVYTYLQYLIASRRLRQRSQEHHIEMLVKRSAFLLATSGREAPALKRRASILNLFKQFRL